MINQVRDEEDKEWIRRRQMRLVQVRKQSSDIAKQLRVRVNNEEQEKMIRKENEMEAKLEIWKMKQLKDLEELYRNAINDIGTAHKLAVEEQDSDGALAERKKLYLDRARERGEMAMEQTLREKREALEKKSVPIQRRLITRQIEDLRSSLVRSIPSQKNNISRHISVKKSFNPKLFESSYVVEKSSQRKISPEEDGNEELNKKTVVSTSENHLTGQCGKQNPGSKTTQKTKRRLQSPYKTKPKVYFNSAKASNTSCPEGTGEKFWVDLGAVEAVTETEDSDAKKVLELEEVRKTNTGNGREYQKKREPKGKTVESGGLRKKEEKEVEPVVEGYGFSVRHREKLKAEVTSVRRIVDQDESDPTELARQEQEQLELEEKQRESRMMMAAERGCRAIEREKINRNYNELLVKLEKLSTKEKLIKSYCHIPPPHMFMSDERRQEKSQRKQRIMDSKFEKIYYETLGINPEDEVTFEMNAGEHVHEPEGTEANSGTKLDAEEEESHLGSASPVSNSDGSHQREERRSRRGSSPVEKVFIKRTPSHLHFKRTKISRGGEIHLADIDRLLKKTRKLRKRSRVNSEHPPSRCKLFAAVSDIHLDRGEGRENDQNKGVGSPSFGSISTDLGKSISLSPCDASGMSDNAMNVKPEEAKKPDESKKGALVDLGMGDLGRGFSGVGRNIIAWPVHQVSGCITAADENCGRSTATEYKPPPSQILPKRINSLIKLLVQLKEREGKSLVADELIVKMEETLDSLIREAERCNITLSEDDCYEVRYNPQLNFYITKLLSMSRERIASLSVSGSDTSMPRAEEGARCVSPERTKNKLPENQYLKQMNMNNKCTNLKRARELETVLKKWKRILGECCGESPEESRCPSDERNPCPPGTSVFDKYEEVSKKCNACISGLSSVLAGSQQPEIVRGVDTESPDEIAKYFNRGNSRRSPRRTASKQEVAKSRSPCRPGFDQAHSPHEGLAPCCYTDQIINPDSPQPGPSGLQGACYRPRPETMVSGSDSGESLPNVMEELLCKGIISTPFSWKQNFGKQRNAEANPERQAQARRIMLENKLREFPCRPSCRGACNIYASHPDDRNKTPPDPAVLRDVRKVLERVPFQLVDDGFGVYSPIYDQKTISLSPPDPEFMPRNIGRRLFGCAPQTQWSFGNRQMHYKVPRYDRPLAQGVMPDPNCFYGVQQGEPIPGMGHNRTPTPTPAWGVWQESDESCSDESTLNRTCIYVGNYAPGQSYGSDCSDRTIIADPQSGGREDDVQAGWSAANRSFPGGAANRTFIKEPGNVCMRPCVVHCSGGNQDGGACIRQPSPGRQGLGGRSMSPGAERFTGMNFPEYSPATGYPGGRTLMEQYNEAEECPVPERRYSDACVEGVGVNQHDTTMHFNRQTI